MTSKTPIEPRRIRRIRGSFSWIDHRFITGGFLATLSRDEILLYFFLIAVGDRNGVSFYSYDRITTLLKMDVDSYIQARDGLMDKSLIAFEEGRFQVLDLPPSPVIRHSPPKRCSAVTLSEEGPKSLAEIFRKLGGV